VAIRDPVESKNERKRQGIYICLHLIAVAARNSPVIRQTVIR